jgi:hypothetical protein
MNRTRLTLVIGFALAALLSTRQVLNKLHLTNGGTLPTDQKQASDRAPTSERRTTSPTNRPGLRLENYPSLSPIVAAHLSNSWRLPFGIQLQDVISTREADILELLAGQGSPSNRVAHLSILGAIGGDQTASRLVKMLLEEFAGQTLDDNDCAAIQNAIFALGCISPRSEVAKEFLENATSESYWSPRRSWRSNNSVRFPDDQLNVQLAQESLIALGVGGQESALLLAEQIRLSTAEEKAQWASTVVDAMFYFDRAKIQKGPVLPEQGEDVANEFMRWATTEKEDDEGRGRRRRRKSSQWPTAPTDAPPPPHVQVHPCT